MSPEAVLDKKFSLAGDVWSFGVVVFEVISGGTTPYPGISNHEIMNLLQSGYRMSAPRDRNGDEIGPPGLFPLAESCWKIDANERPTFTSLWQQLRSLLAGEKPEQLSDSQVATPAYLDDAFAEARKREEQVRAANCCILLSPPLPSLA